MSLFETIKIDHDVVKSSVKRHWNVTLGKLLKASQNHTFLGTQGEDDNANKVIVRVTPDPRKEQLQRIEVETSFLNFLSHEYPSLNVCAPINSLLGQSILIEGELVIVVFQHAKGEPVQFTEFKWMTESTMVEAMGKWFANFHIASKDFSKRFPEVRAKTRLWTQLHQSVLEGTPVHADDESVASDPTQFGLLHGDLNCTNYYFDYNSSQLHVFDWDQVMLGWFLYDLSQPIFGVYMLARGGMPIDGKKVESANPEQFTNWVVKGYESVTGEPVDRARLQRMVDLKKTFYYKFCSRAVEELKDHRDRAPGMFEFCQFITNWIESDK
eukprot:TRINITY_DN758_c0_g1_i2.p2 TRINITY_DN758_c0_g1~~TRINITY_DN758_c0_g1_i2.p2  ORF type:complete len:326 (+),score=47.48 TRINITY_DN758_c0_g1_i2:371-1348(+)